MDPRPKHYFNQSTLSWVIIRKLPFSQILRRGHYWAKSLWSVTGFKFDILFMVIYTCAKYYLDPSILSWVIIRTLFIFPNSQSKMGPLLYQILVECDQIQTSLSFYGYIHMCKIWFGIRQSFHELSSGHGNFFQSLSKKEAITPSKFGGV